MSALRDSIETNFGDYGISKALASVQGEGEGGVSDALWMLRFYKSGGGDECWLWV